MAWRGVAWRAANDVVFSVTFLVIKVGQIVKAPLHQRKVSKGSGKSGK